MSKLSVSRWLAQREVHYAEFPWKLGKCPRTAWAQPVAGKDGGSDALACRCWWVELPDLYALARCWIWQKRLLSPLIWPVGSYLSGDLWLQHQFMWRVTASDDPVPLRVLRNTSRTHHWSFFIHVLHRFELQTWPCSMAAQLFWFRSFDYGKQTADPRHYYDVRSAPRP